MFPQTLSNNVQETLLDINVTQMEINRWTLIRPTDCETFEGNQNVSVPTNVSLLS